MVRVSVAGPQSRYDLVSDDWDLEPWYFVCRITFSRYLSMIIGVHPIWSDEFQSTIVKVVMVIAASNRALHVFSSLFH